MKKELKIKDVMVGDWVDVRNDADPNTPHLERITPSHFLRDEHWYGVELVPEILKKNGFYYGYTSNEEDLASNTIAQLSEEDKGWVWDEGAGSIKVIFPNESDGGEIQICDQSFDRSMSFVFAENMMLHEFQNLLTICRIEKEIIL